MSFHHESTSSPMAIDDAANADTSIAASDASAAASTASQDATRAAASAFASSSSFVGGGGATSSSATLEVHHQCTRCGVESATACCAKCRLDWYCSRECQKADWITHKKVCEPPLLHVPPPVTSPSIVKSKLTDRLWAHACSFLSHYQAGVMATVNHALRNATMLPSAASFTKCVIDDTYRHIWRHMSNSARQNALSIQWDEIQSMPPQALPRLRQLTINLKDPAGPYAEPWRTWLSRCTSLRSLCAQGGFLQAAPESLQRAFSPLVHLTSLHVFGVITSVAVDVIRRLTQLESLGLAATTIIDHDTMAQIEQKCAGGRKSLIDPRDLSTKGEAHGRRLLNHLAQSSRFREFTLVCTTSESLLPLSVRLRHLIGVGAPIFPYVQSLRVVTKALEPNELAEFAQLSTHFPSLTSLSVSMEPFLTDVRASRTALFTHLHTCFKDLGDSMRSLRILLDHQSNHHHHAPPNPARREPITRPEMSLLVSACPLLTEFSLEARVAPDVPVWSPEATLCVVEGLPHIQELSLTLPLSATTLHRGLQLEHLHKLHIKVLPEADGKARSPQLPPPAADVQVSLVHRRLDELILEHAHVTTLALPLFRQLPAARLLLLQGCKLDLVSVLELAQHRPVAFHHYRGEGVASYMVDLRTVDEAFFTRHPGLQVLDMRALPPSAADFRAAYRHAVLAARSPESVWSHARFDSVAGSLSTVLPHRTDGPPLSEVCDLISVGAWGHRLYGIHLSQLKLLNTLMDQFNELRAFRNESH